jgi:hypothetical protein
VIRTNTLYNDDLNLLKVIRSFASVAQDTFPA